MVNPTGYTALDLVGYTDKGTYSNSANYVANDLVHYGGNIWRCKVDDTTGVAPVEGADWTLFIGEPTNMAERMIAPLEVSPSLNAYAVGAQLIYNDTLYEVISAISVGDTLTVDSNIQLAPKVSAQIQTLTNNDDAILNILGAKNLLPNNAVTQTINGVTFTVNSDGTVRANGTATANSYIYLFGSSNITKTFDFPVIGTGCPSDNPNGALRIGFAQGYVDTGEGVNISSNTPVSPFVFVTNGTTVNNVVFNPMIRPASIADDTYAPYAMTNRELSERAIKTEKNAINVNTRVVLTTSDYSASADGYISIYAPYTNDYCRIDINGILMMRAIGSEAQSLFVRKGTNIRVNAKSNDSTAYFYPLG